LATKNKFVVQDDGWRRLVIHPFGHSGTKLIKLDISLVRFFWAKKKL